MMPMVVVNLRLCGQSNTGHNGQGNKRQEKPLHGHISGLGPAGVLRTARLDTIYALLG